MNIPDSIQTELGEATIGVVKPKNAVREYLCPLCGEDIEAKEEHLIAVPLVISRLRRHLHTECLQLFVSNGYTIKLHPNEPDTIKYYM